MRSTSIVLTSFLVVTVSLPLLLLIALLYDLAAVVTGRRYFMAVRLIASGWVYLGAECIGITALGGLWLATGGGRIRPVFISGTYAIQRWWAGALFATIRTLFAFRIEVEGSELLGPGPILIFMRHTSIIDNLLPNVLITAPHTIKLRYVLKRDLLSDPALDIAGSRLPNYFVDRRSTDSEAEIAAIGRLGSGLGIDEGVLIYPEGTRFTAERRTRALEHLRSSSPDLYERAAALRSVLPPRLGGPLALLDAQPRADVVIAAHTGLDGFSHIRQILGGGLVGSTIQVRFRRFAHSDIPTDPAQQADWLYDRWAEVDDWIETHEGQRRGDTVTSFIDKALDATIVTGFTNIGYRIRKKSWEPITDSMAGKTVVVTGATSGLGKAAAIELADLGANVIVVGRNPDKTRAVQAEVAAARNSDKVRYELADLSLMSEVRALADRLLADEPAIDVLVNNAGKLFTERSVTAEGIESTLATNLLGHFLLTSLLIPRLVQSAPARIINVSSGGMYSQRISISNLQNDRGEYKGSAAYARTKRGQVILTEMWAEQLAGRGVTANAMHPGWADTPGVVHSLPTFQKITKPFLRTPAEGADTIVWLAASEAAAGQTGLFWHDRRPRSTYKTSRTIERPEARTALWQALSDLSGWNESGS